MGSSKKPAQATSQNITTTTLPSYSRPYFEDVLARTQGEANRPYQTYGGQRTAGFTDAEKQSQQGIMGLTTPGQFGAATQMATNAGNYTPGQFDGGYDQAQFTGGNYGTGQFDGGYNQTQFTGGDYSTGQFDNTYNPTQFTGGDYNTGQFNGGYDPTQFTGGNYATGQFGTNSFNDPGMASQYMSPYMQNVVDVQKQSAIRDAKQSQLAGNLGASRQGTYGGSRQLLANMERERNLGTQLGSIQATGLQSAYDAAQKQFGSEQDRRMQAQQYGEQSRQFGGSQNMEAQRQAEQSRQFGSSQGMEAQRQAEQSRQFGSNRQLQAQEAQDRANQFGANFGMDAQKQREASRQFGSSRQLQEQQERERANQFGANFGMDAQRQAEQSRQFGAAQRTQAEESAARERQFGANYSMDAQRQAEQSRQFGAGQGLAAAQALGQFGTAQQQADMQRLNAQNAVGETQRGLDQTRLDTAYGDFQRQRDYPMQQLSQYANIVQGLPNTPNTTSTQYAQAPSALAGLAGTAAAAYGGYKTFGAAGGEMRSYNNGGLVALAEGGVGSDGNVGGSDGDGNVSGGGGDENPIGDLGKQAKDLAALMRGDLSRIAKIPGINETVKAMALAEVERAMKAPQAPTGTVFQNLLNQSQDQQGLASIAPPPMDPTQSQPPMMAANGGLMNINLPDDYYDEDSYAHGGIAHFQEAGLVPKVYRGATSAEDKRKILEARLRQAQEEGDTETFNRIIGQLQELNTPPEDSTEFVSDVKGLGRSIKDAFTPSDLTKGFIGSSVDYFAKTPKQRKENEAAYFASLGVTPDTSTATPTAKPPVEPQPAGLPQPTAPQGLAQLQEVDMSTMPTRTPDKVDYMAKAKELYAGVPSGAMTDEEMAKDKEQRKYEALMQFGLNLAGTGSLSEAGKATMPAIIEARTAQNAAMATRKKEDRDTKIAQIQTALGLEKDDAEKVFKQQELALKTQEGLDRSKLTAAQIDNLGKPDNIYDLMESNPAVAEKLIAIQNAKDLTPTARAGLIKSLIESVTDPKQKADLQNIAMSMVMGGNTGASATLDYNALNK
jgi:hypothetical protein